MSLSPGGQSWPTNIRPGVPSRYALASNLFEVEQKAAAELGIAPPKLKQAFRSVKINEILEAPLNIVVESYALRAWPGSSPELAAKSIINLARTIVKEVDPSQIPATLQGRFEAVWKISTIWHYKERDNWNNDAAEIADIAHKALGLDAPYHPSEPLHTIIAYQQNNDGKDDESQRSSISQSPKEGEQEKAQILTKEFALEDTLSITTNRLLHKNETGLYNIL